MTQSQRFSELVGKANKFDQIEDEVKECLRMMNKVAKLFPHRMDSKTGRLPDRVAFFLNELIDYMDIELSEKSKHKVWSKRAQEACRKAEKLGKALDKAFGVKECCATKHGEFLDEIDQYLTERSKSKKGKTK